jgi:trimeric autotransporter adhesin
MSKLIGTNPNQVPSNADLGTAAFMDATDFLTSRGSSLSAVNAVIPKTAVDVFVYDTSRDSDGGAWRKRTQHLSWYNERLNTTTRGSRKEFPAVAVIVADSDSVTIYDGDDPSMPMWMVFNTNLSSCWFNTTTSFSLFAKNGILAAGGNDTNQRLRLAFFLKDHCEDWATANSGGGHRASLGNFLDRNSQSSAGRTIDSTIGIIERTINDVAMTVLPNAPIDSATGLPVPTIVVATDGGTSIIKNDGTVVDINDALNGRAVTNVIIRGNDVTHWNVPNGTVQQFFDALSLTSDNTSDCKYNYSYGGGGGSTENITAILLETLDSNRHLANGKTYKDIHVANSDGVSKIHDGYDREFSTNTFSIFDSSVAYMTSAYNTGWMHGDIKLATLSDTDDTNLGTELVTNGTFTSNVTGWSTNPSVASWSSVSGQAVLVQDSNSSSYWAWQQVTVVAGKTYRVSIDVISTTNTSYFRVGSGGEGSETYLTVNGIGTGTTTRTFTVPAGVTSVFINVGVTISGTIVFDNVSLKEDVADRSVQGNGLQVFGTVTKTAVATGAELMGYSGFSTTGSKVNYLRMPYASVLDFDTSFCFMGWIKIDGAVGTQDQHFFDMINDNNGNRVNVFYQHSTTNFYIAPGNGGSNVGSAAVQFGHWYHVVALANTVTTDIYVNGELSGTGAGGFNHTWPNGSVTLGTRFAEYNSNAYGLNGSMALIRLSKSTPSPEQIKKIYNDEKFLFQENAKATLYGSSDAVTALAYDDDTELLHVGTSAGRSVFQGLRRIDNTTDAVGVAISASNGMVAED